jgi:hypothetical protein
VAHRALAARAIRAGKSLSPGEWRETRERAIFEFCKWDMQCEDHSVLADFPLLIDSDTARFLSHKAEALTREALAVEAEILHRSDLLWSLGLPRAIQRMLEYATNSDLPCAGLRVMRFDFHPTPEGWRISEVNADVPGGFIEAGAWNALFAERYVGAVNPDNPALTYAKAVLGVAREGGLVALAHTTAYSDDRQVMMYLARTLAQFHVRGVLCSPGHLRWKRGCAEFAVSFASGNPDAIVRFFPAEWLPKLPNAVWRQYFQDSETPLSNPGKAIVLQSKRFALVWPHLRSDISAWRELLPETRCFTETKRPGGPTVGVEAGPGTSWRGRGDQGCHGQRRIRGDCAASAERTDAMDRAKTI